MEIDQDKVWSKIFGIPIASHTVPDTTYTVALTSKGWTCTCMDYRIRKGSYDIFFDAEHFQACKHVIDHLTNLGQQDKDNNGIVHRLRYRKGNYGYLQAVGFK